MLLTAPSRRHEGEVVIEQARQRQRRRRRRGAVLAVIAAAAAVAGVLVSLSGSSPTVRQPLRASGSPRPRPAPVSVPTTPRLHNPAALAVGPHGVLYIADGYHNAVFARHRDGRITRVAGTGKAGFSGDGGPARRAELKIPGGMLYDRANRTLYIADTDNNRVRAVNPRGQIHTVVGDGRGGWARSGTPARSAHLFEPFALALAPDGDLVIAAEAEVVRLDSTGVLTKLAGTHRGPQGEVGIGGPATRASDDGADGLAFDSKGDLFLTGFNTKSLIAIAPDGTMRNVARESLYPRGNGGAVTAPDGSVLVMGTQAIYDYTGIHHRTTVANFTGAGLIDGIHAVAPAGLAVSGNGTIYFDTDDRDGWSNRSAILALNGHGRHPTLLWEARR